MNRWKTYIQGIFNVIAGTKKEEKKITVPPTLNGSNHSIQEKDLVPLIFKDPLDVDKILNDPDESIAYFSMLKYGTSEEKFLILDWKGEFSHEITDYMAEYERSYSVKLASEHEFRRLSELEYDYLPDKIKAVNKVIAPEGYGLFTFPTLDDTYALFISELEHKEALTQVDLLEDENSPDEASYIQYYV
ncbi:hypothetical protein J2W91_004708 [Paenibacillus amylolyticus]|uniref:DUF6630 domain-containing protein n=1 Tax=Paenibacillus amylolyticus TaxID=1451 RepID=A0AAP5LNY0_PAEAM|nr:hypothetical protein [Paenibacillus amylolyticus]MDR6726202.1 hypothetical protein [Paenibacillus amylolyticus]